MKEQPCATKWHKSKTNLEHSFNAFSSDYIEDADYLLKIAALFHDIGKLSTQDKDFHAKEHDIIGANAAKTFLRENWKFTNKDNAKQLNEGEEQKISTKKSVKMFII